MATTKKGKATELMMSLYSQEATFGAGVTMNDTNACSMKGFTGEPEWPDEVANDKDEITGSEFATDQEILSKGYSRTYSEPRARPNSVIGLMALALGGTITSTKDGAVNAWSHRVAPAALEGAMPSIQVEEKRGGLQHAYTGVKCNTIKLACEQGGYLSLEAGLLGSGTRATSATAFASKISESWIKAAQASVWKESAGSISIDGSLTQGAENISSGTPADLKGRIQQFEFNLNNKMDGQFGFGSEVFQDIDKVIRELSLTMTLLFNDTTELDHYTNQDNLALELDFKGALIAAGAMYYGCQLIVPCCRLKVAALPKGGPTDFLTVDLDVEFLDDGTNDIVIFEGYNAKSAYLA